MSKLKALSSNRFATLLLIAWLEMAESGAKFFPSTTVGRTYFIFLTCHSHGFADAKAHGSFRNKALHWFKPRVSKNGTWANHLAQCSTTFFYGAPLKMF